MTETLERTLTASQMIQAFKDQKKIAAYEAKMAKEDGIPIVGYYCGFFPEQMVWAAGGTTVMLCSTDGSVIAEAEKDLPVNLCPIVKSSYGMAKTDKCPFFHFADIVVGETTCEGKIKMYEMLNNIKPIYLMHLPNYQNDRAKKRWVAEMGDLKVFLEEKLGKKITEENLIKAVKLKNEIQEAKNKLCSLMELDPAPISGHDLFEVLNASLFIFDKESIPARYNALYDKLIEEYNPTKLNKKPRILITGCPLGGTPEKIIDMIEKNGGDVVSFENCSGEKNRNAFVDLEADNIYESMAESYLNIGCAIMSPDKSRFRLLNDLIYKYSIDGVVEMNLHACHPYIIESYRIKKLVMEDKETPYINIITDFSDSDSGQLNTRLGAFVEML